MSFLFPPQMSPGHQGGILCIPYFQPKNVPRTFLAI